MAANKKSANTSKTAHVMNLISKNKEPAPEEAAVEVKAAGGVSTPEPASSSTPPVIASLSSDAAVSDQIKNALEDVLEAEAPAAPPQPGSVPGPAPVPEQAAEPAPAAPAQPVTEAAPAQPQPEAVAAPGPEPAPEPEPAPAPEPQSAAQPEPAPAAVPGPEIVSAPAAAPEPAPAQAASPEPAPAPEPEPEAKHDDNDLAYVNVMQALVEEKAMKYIKMFGMCQCERCVIDVKATALNNLTPKYVVMKKGEMIPRITIYEGRFNTTVTAQLLNACKLVMDNPRH